MERLIEEIAKVCISILMFFAPVMPMLYVMFLLITFDWVTGIWKSRIEKHVFSSLKLRASVSKVALYFILVVSTFAVEKAFIPKIGITQIMISYVAFTELVSIYENVSVIVGKPFMKDLTSLIKKEFNKKFISNGK